MYHDINQSIQQSILIKEQIIKSPDINHLVQQSIKVMVDCLKKDGKVLFCGNGGSAADAQHLAAELSGRFNYDRPALQAEALHVNSSFVTAVANDYGYEYVFARMVEAWGREGDILVAMSTSGNSPVVIKAIEASRRRKMYIIGFTGKEGGQMSNLCDILLKIPSTDTPRIQESHILLGHIICEHVESQLFPPATSKK